MKALREEMEEITLVDPRESEKTKLLEKVTLVFIHLDHPDFHVMIGTELTKELRSALVEFLERNYDVFAWSQSDISGIDPQVATHKLFTNPDYALVCHERRKFAPEQLKVIKEEVAKLIKANINRESHYSDWLEDVVVAPKRGKVENMC